MRHQGSHGGGRHKPSPTAIRLLREAVQQAQREHRPLAQVAEKCQALSSRTRAGGYRPRASIRPVDGGGAWSHSGGARR